MATHRSVLECGFEKGHKKMWLNAGDKNETPNFHDCICNPVMPQLLKDAKKIVSN